MVPLGNEYFLNLGWLTYNSNCAKYAIYAKYPQNCDPKLVAGFSCAMEKELLCFMAKA